MDHNVKSRDHLRGIPVVKSVSRPWKLELEVVVLHVVVDLNLREQSNIFWSQTKVDGAAAVA